MIWLGLALFVGWCFLARWAIEVSWRLYCREMTKTDELRSERDDQAT